MSVLKPQTQKIDRWLLLLVSGLTVFGIVMVYNASVVTAFRDFGDKYFYARQQMISVGIGLFLLFILSKINYRRYLSLAPLFLLANIFLLLIVLIPHIGISALGAKRWLGFGKFSFQPAELAKISLILYFASYFSKRTKLINFLGILGLIIFLVMLEPDLGTTVVLVLSSLAIYFASGSPILSLLGIGIVGFIGGVGLILASPYRKERLLTFFDIGRDPLGASYHIRQILLAIGSGGLFGMGLGASRQKYEYLPESMTDSIFAIISEEMGFLGAVVLILAFLFIIWRGFKIAQEAPDTFGKLLAVGITSWIGFQAMVNFASMVALVPLTGIPLPFISFGGSSLVVVLAGVGILLNISKYRVKKK
ncbi:MAG: putative lipid II flippase FtsW [bacterium]|nr:putative lipid II flippase FtsW [bacterium]